MDKINNKKHFRKRQSRTGIKFKQMIKNLRNKANLSSQNTEQAHRSFISQIKMPNPNLQNKQISQQNYRLKKNSKQNYSNWNQITSNFSSESVNPEKYYFKVVKIFAQQTDKIIKQETESHEFQKDEIIDQQIGKASINYKLQPQTPFENPNIVGSIKRQKDLFSCESSNSQNIFKLKQSLEKNIIVNSRANLKRRRQQKTNLNQIRIQKRLEEVYSFPNYFQINSNSSKSNIQKWKPTPSYLHKKQSDQNILPNCLTHIEAPDLPKVKQQFVIINMSPRQLLRNKSQQQRSSFKKYISQNRNRQEILKMEYPLPKPSLSSFY